ncbi:MAG TPA: ABC transporter ATP-binding protein [Burkholderiales bacterium]
MAARQGHRLHVERVSQRFGITTALDEVDLEVRAGELVALLGPSGCGKSTLLRIVAGFLRQSAGRVLFDGVPVDHLPANRRGVGIVFQNYALFPHLSVRENVAYGLQAQHWPREGIAPRVDEMLDRVHLRELAGRMPRELSGGQQQRVALARCLAVDPKILLLDEPFGALDKSLRLDMQIEVKRLQRDYGITTVLVTHDQEEALSMADRIAVMNRGRIEQFASPSEIYDRPATLFVNRFVGTANVVPAEKARAWAPAAPQGALVCLRPEQLRLRGDAGPRSLAATVKAVMPLGPQVVYEVETDSGFALRITAGRGAGDAQGPLPGERVFVEPAAGSESRVFAAPQN